VVHQVAQVLAPGCVPLFLTDGYKEYATALLSHFGYWVAPGLQQTKPRWMPLPRLLYAQVMKTMRRRRLIEVAEDLAEAESMHDLVRAERAAAERDALVDELAAITGLGGRARRAGSDTERMRKAVGNRIRQALARVEAVHPELGRHLRLSVRTGTFCRYEPDAEVRWEL